MVQSYANFKTATLNVVQDASTVNFGSSEMDTFIADACREAGQYVPHIVKVSFTIESRTGTATSTSADNLVDATESQFVAGDVGKEVYNTTTKTWAVITSYSSATTVALSNDIMTLNDTYKIFNSGCSANDEINLVGIDDYQNIESVEYPVGQKRNWSLEGTILTVKIDVVDDSKVVTSGTRTNTEVVVRFKKRHLISQLTDFAGVIAASAAVSATSISMSALQSSGTIETGQEFTIANVRGTYTVTSDATIASNTVAVTIYPGLESAIAGTGSVVTIKGSTLTPTLEPLVQKLAAGLAAQSKPMSLYQHAFSATTAVGLTTAALTSVAGLVNAATADANSARTAMLASTVAIAAMTARIAAATADITSGLLYAATAGTSSIPSATTEIAKIVSEINTASSALTSGYGLVNTIPIGGGAGEFMGQASADMGIAQGRMANGQTWLQKAASELTVANAYFNAGGLELRAASERTQESNANLANAGQYLNSASLDLRAAGEKISEGNASLQKAATELSIVRSGQIMEAWAVNILRDTRSRLKAIGGLPSWKRYPRD